jgi:hypothetical protein
MPHLSPARASPILMFMLLGCMPTASLAANCTDTSDNMDLFDLCDGWSIAAVVLLVILGVVLLTRLCMACVKIERPALDVGGAPAIEANGGAAPQAALAPSLLRV